MEIIRVDRSTKADDEVMIALELEQDIVEPTVKICTTLHTVQWWQKICTPYKRVIE